MKVRYEKKVTDCHNGSIGNKCDLYQISLLDKKWHCCIDGKRFEVIEGKGYFPCQLRPCPCAEVESNSAPKLYTHPNPTIEAFVNRLLEERPELIQKMQDDLLEHIYSTSEKFFGFKPPAILAKVDRDLLDHTP